MASQNALLKRLGYPVVTQEEHENIAQTFSALADPESLTVSVLAEAPAPAPAPTPATSPDKDLSNIFYVNFNPKTDTQSEHLRKTLENLEDNVDLSNQFLNATANTAVKEKVDTKVLEDKEIPRANYKAKVINHLVSTAPWTAGFAVQALQKKFTVEKDKFHATLVSTFTDGLGLPQSINAELEGILTNIKNTINISSGTTAKENLLFFILISIYKKIDVMQTWQPYIRTIYFRVNQSLSTYTRSKNDKSSGINIDVDIEYAQTDGAFNNRFFEAKAKTSISGIVNVKTQSFINSKTDVAV